MKISAVIYIFFCHSMQFLVRLRANNMFLKTKDKFFEFVPDCNNATKFTIKKSADPLKYAIVDALTNKAFDLYDAERVMNLWDYHGGANQLFTIITNHFGEALLKDKNGKFIYFDAASNKLTESDLIDKEKYGYEFMDNELCSLAVNPVDRENMLLKKALSCITSAK